MREEKVAGIILAAGGSFRLGKPKQLLDWFGKPFINQIIDTAIKSGLDPLVVVTGAHSQEVENRIKHKKIHISRNDQWEKGQSSSMIQGVNALEAAKAFIILLCDQPQVTVELLNMIVRSSKEEEYDIVATMVNNKICPPILFKPICISEINRLEGDQGGKVLFKKFNVKTVEWKDTRLILDSDTEEDYAKLVAAYKL